MAFGLQIESNFPVQSLLGTAETPTGSNRRTTLELTDAKQVKKLWSEDGPGERLFDRRLGRRPGLLVDRDADGGYRIWAPSYGRYHVSPDGLRIRTFIPRLLSSWHWQRLLVAQPLPLAAALQGLALVHASAVAVDGRAFAFLASSGTGKTSVAVHLVARGATHITDDIVALEAQGQRVLAHPGPCLAGVSPSELERVVPSNRVRLGRIVGRAGQKTYLEMPVANRPLPLAAIYHLRRDRDAESLTFVGANDPRLLLASSFLSYLQAPAHLEQHLHVCGRVADSIRMATVLFPPSASAVDVAAALEADMARAE